MLSYFWCYQPVSKSYSFSLCGLPCGCDVVLPPVCLYILGRSCQCSYVFPVALSNLWLVSLICISFTNFDALLSTQYWWMVVDSCCWCAVGNFFFIFFNLFYYSYSCGILLEVLLGALVGASGLFLPCLALVQAWLLLVPLLCLASTY